MVKTKNKIPGIKEIKLDSLEKSHSLPNAEKLQKPTTFFDTRKVRQRIRIFRKKIATKKKSDYETIGPKDFWQIAFLATVMSISCQVVFPPSVEIPENQPTPTENLFNIL
jgi:hypothetical protein